MVGQRQLGQSAPLGACRYRPASNRDGKRVRRPPIRSESYHSCPCRPANSAPSIRLRRQTSELSLGDQAFRVPRPTPSPPLQRSYRTGPEKCQPVGMVRSHAHLSFAIIRLIDALLLAAIWFDLPSFTRDVRASGLLEPHAGEEKERRSDCFCLPALKEGKTMAVLQATKSKTSPSATHSDRLFVLELNAGRIHSMNPDGSDKKTIVTDCRNCDGIVVDEKAGHVYWTNMGIPNLDDGSIERADLDGRNRRVIIPEGITHTPKQIHLDKENGKLYWCDREGMRVMRANLGGSQIETLVEAGRGDKDSRDQTRWCVGITIDPKLRKMYCRQKGPDDAG